MQKNITITESGVKELEEKLDYLRTVRRPEVSEQIKIARGFGDLSENAEYDEAKNEQARVEGEIAQLEQMLRNAVVVPDRENHTDHVAIGSKIRVRDVEFDEEEVYTIVGPMEVDLLHNKISNESPVGSGLLGHKAGERVDIETPSGTVSYDIIEIM